MDEMKKQTTGGPVDARELRRYGLLMGGIICCLFGLILPWLFDGTYRVWPWVVGGAFASVALAAPRLLQPVYRLWMRFGHIMGAINTRIILFVLFYLIVTPIGFVMRMRRDPMRRDRANKATYKVMSRTRARDNLERPF